MKTVLFRTEDWLTESAKFFDSAILAPVQDRDGAYQDGWAPGERGGGGIKRKEGIRLERPLPGGADGRP